MFGSAVPGEAATRIVSAVMRPPLQVGQRAARSGGRRSAASLPAITPWLRPEIVNLNERRASRIILATQNRGVIARRGCGQDRRLRVICGCNPGGGDIGLLGIL